MADDVSLDEKHLRQLDREWNEAYPRRDVATLERVIADDWMCIDGAGERIGKAELLERVASGASRLESHVFDEMELRIYGDAAIVTGRLTGKGRDEEGQLSFSQRYTRVYVKRDGAWRAVATQVTVLPKE
ncbi:MAG TPA: nuclear transport factor 2 family protein [Pyrinomonadaceae bacterium]|nr:nuclear transport factor 2 family protein [Pyrinomonadaceae bacterium]